MITKPENLQLVNEIANLFCTGKPAPFTCKANVRNRINAFCNDSLFESVVLPYLSHDNFISMKVIGIEPQPQQKVKINFEFIDVISGYQNQLATPAIPVALLAQKAWQTIFHSLDAGSLYYNFVAVYPPDDRFFIRVNTPNHYGITVSGGYTGGGGTSGGGGTPGGGGNIIPTKEPAPVTVPGGQQPPVAEFDLKKILIPVAAVLAFKYLV